MKLKSIRVAEFQSVRDSDFFEVGDITCLVGKNEAGKTALLQALYRLNPIDPTEGNFDVVEDYPRSDVIDYEHDVETGKRVPAEVVQAVYELSDSDLDPIYAEFGKKVLKKSELTLYKDYANEVRFNIETDEESALKHLFEKAELTPEISTLLKGCTSVEEAIEAINAQEEEKTVEVASLSTVLTEIKDKDIDCYIYDKHLSPILPKFVYFAEYYQMRGFENIEALMERVEEKDLLPSDHPMLGLIELARLDLEELLNPDRTQDLVNKLEGAGNHLSKRVLKYWSQNKHLYTKFDVRPALPGDPEDMRTGMNIWAGIHDSRHMVTTNMGSRSRGFVWFFSFLAWYSKLQKRNERIILLLDEPGLVLHAKAQEDLLRYFEEELKPSNHQLIYTTHSPFMVDPQHFERVRIVQDKGIDTLDTLAPEEDGTKVLTDVLEASEDSLFPLQGALGYEIYQTLFIGPYSLVVEGVSDLLYIQTISGLLEGNGKKGLSSKWTITPVGGSDKVPTFVALIGAQKGLKVATLIDIQKKDRQTIENLYKKKLLKKKNVLTFADFTGTNEADIEDMFDVNFYLNLVNNEFESNLQKPISRTSLNNKLPRITVQLEAYFNKHPMKKNTSFNHYRPARYLAENVGALKAKISNTSLGRFEQAFNRINKLL